MPCLANPSKTIKPKITSPLGSYCKYLYNAEKQGVLRDTQGKKRETTLLPLSQIGHQKLK